MKTNFLTLFIVLFGLTFQTLRAEDLCTEALKNHINEIDSSESFLKELRIKSTDITSYEITLFQKNMTKRYESLKKLQELYKTQDCSPKVLATAVSIYDFSLVGNSVFSDSTLRRVFMGFAKYPSYKLTDFVSEYKQSTTKEFIDSTIAEIAQTHTDLPKGIDLQATDREYDPNLYALSDTAIKTTTAVVAGAARVWGFISDRLKWRHGRIKNNEDAIKSIKEKIKPLDLIYETRKFTLSNLTIPGHWGHVGIWLGTKEELIALGIWDQAYFAPFQKHIEAGHNIIEIRKEGLNFQGLETFINLDEIAVTRIKNITDQANSIYEGLSEQTDKKYDFKFDARSADKITCAELITYTYGDIKWAQTKTLFQVSIRPDDIALSTFDANTGGEFVLYYKGIKTHDGGGFESMTFADWKTALKFKTPEEIAIEKELKAKKIREIRERNEHNKIYAGA